MLTPLEILARFAVALMLGGIIGFERQWHRRTAGIRTNALVCIGAAGFVIFATYFPHEASPTRIAAQIVSGIGFLGAGVIMREGLTVRGLNSAATIWCSSTVGVFSGGGLFIEASMLTGAIMVTNLLLRQFVRDVNNRFFSNGAKAQYVYELVIACHLDHQLHIRDYLRKKMSEQNMAVKSFDSFIDDVTESFKFILTLTSEEKKEDFLNDLISEFTFSNEIKSAEWVNVYQESDRENSD